MRHGDRYPRAPGIDLDCVVERVIEASGKHRLPSAVHLPTPEQLGAALDELLPAMRTAEAAGNPAFIGPLGDRGIELLTDLAQWAARFGLVGAGGELHRLAVSVSLWVGRLTGELRLLEPLVNPVASMANALHDPRDLEALSRLMEEIRQSVADDIRADVDKTNPARPWRVLNWNAGLVATRCGNLQAMERAFDTLCANLPEDAPSFFAEGMGQIDALDYPADVRAMVERYYRRWSTRKLH